MKWYLLARITNGQLDVYDVSPFFFSLFFPFRDFRFSSLFFHQSWIISYSNFFSFFLSSFSKIDFRKKFLEEIVVRISKIVEIFFPPRYQEEEERAMQGDKREIGAQLWRKRGREKRKGRKYKSTRMERKNAKGPAVNLSTFPPALRPGICWSRRTTRTYIRKTLHRLLSSLPLFLRPLSGNPSSSSSFSRSSRF